MIEDFFQIDDLRVRCEELFCEYKKLRCEYKNNVQSYLNSKVFDSEWEEYLKQTACDLASSQLRLQIAFSKMLHTRDILLDKVRTND